MERNSWKGKLLSVAKETKLHNTTLTLFAITSGLFISHRERVRRHIRLHTPENQKSAWDVIGFSLGSCTPARDPWRFGHSKSIHHEHYMKTEDHHLKLPTGKLTGENLNNFIRNKTTRGRNQFFHLKYQECIHKKIPNEHLAYLRIEFNS